MQNGYIDVHYKTLIHIVDMSAYIKCFDSYFNIVGVIILYILYKI